MYVHDTLISSFHHSLWSIHLCSGKFRIDFYNCIQIYILLAGGFSWFMIHSVHLIQFLYFKRFLSLCCKHTLTAREKVSPVTLFQVAGTECYFCHSKRKARQERETEWVSKREKERKRETEREHFMTWKWAFCWLAVSRRLSQPRPAANPEKLNSIINSPAAYTHVHTHTHTSFMETRGCHSSTRCP